MKYLDSNPPKLTAEEAAACLLRHFGIEGDLTPLYSDRDQNHRVDGTDGRRFIFKICNAEEAPAAIALQTAALDHLSSRNLDLALPEVVRTTGGEAWARLESAAGQEHMIRLVSFVEGDLLETAPPTPALRRSLGGAVARLDLGLRGFFHAAADQDIVWRVGQAATLAGEVERVVESHRRPLATEIFQRYEKDIRPRLAGLRAQVIHNDVTAVNALVRPDDPEKVAGIIDFGDIVFDPLIVELAVTAADTTTAEEAPLEAIGQLLAGYDAVLPLESQEVDLLFDLVALRHANNAVICAWRKTHSADRDNYLLAYEEPTWHALERLLAIDRREARDYLREVCRLPEVSRPGIDPESARAALLNQRGQSYGAGHALFYDQPLHLVRGAGVWLYDQAGRAYLDCYNNVPQVGHAHPHVANAVARQVAALNTNTRYLYRNLSAYAERLTALMPDPLDLCVFFSSGSEANDFAWRLARAATGKTGALAIDDAYHGVTEAVFGFSPIEWTERSPGPDWARPVKPPHRYHAPTGASEAEVAAAALLSLDQAIASLAEAGLGTAGFILDTALTSSGVLDLPAGYLEAAFARVRQAGGLCIADEVQIGFARTGTHFWRFQAEGVIPDIVTLGKPMGNGMPLSAVVTSRAIFEAFKAGSGLFSSVGGNPVSCAAGMAVLDVIEREDLQANAARVGAYVKDRLKDLAQRHSLIGDVRGQGLLVAIEFVEDRATKQPAVAKTKALVEALVREGIMTGTEGTAGNVIKIRPPLVFQEAHAELLLKALDQALAAQ